MSLTFDAATHSYFWSGKRVPSVTQILGAVIDTTFMNEAGRDRGTMVHTLTQLDDENALADSPLPHAVAGRLKAYRAFKQECEPVWAGIEERVYHKVHGYAGTLDRRGFMELERGSVYGVVDLKTGEDNPAYALQLSGYVEALPRDFSVDVPARFTLFLRADGTYRLREIKTKHREDFSVFLSLLVSSRWREKNNI